MESGCRHGSEEPVAEPGRSQPAAVLGEHEVSGLSGARMRDRAMAASPVCPLVERCERGFVEWHGAFGGELAQRHPQPGPGRSVVHDGIDLKVEELADA